MLELQISIFIPGLKAHVSIPQPQFLDANKIHLTSIPFRIGSVYELCGGFQAPPAISKRDRYIFFFFNCVSTVALNKLIGTCDERLNIVVSGHQLGHQIIHREKKKGKVLTPSKQSHVRTTIKVANLRLKDAIGRSVLTCCPPAST